ncbi:MAG: hypothetical protein JXB38_00505 [Anaerolineales bacterium]|nr:hypothetical protein [Anaerolineales bacterium]
MTDDLLVEDGLELADERDAPIEIYFGNPALDMGIATLPKILPRFWTFLVSDGDRLNDRQYALLLQVLLLRNTQDYELRVGNLPMASSLITLERDKKVLRRLGLVFTERIYYPTRPGKPPRMQAQRWDMRSLFFNLEQIAYRWKSRQNELTSRWEVSGRKGRKPVYNFPKSYAHEIMLPGEVALDVLKGTFYPIPAKWTQKAHTLLENLPDQVNPPGVELPTGPKKSGTLPTGRFKSGTPTRPEKSVTPPTGPDSRGHLLKDDEDEEEDGAATLVERVFVYFAERKGGSDYHPTVKEQLALEKLLTDGFTFEQIIAGVDAAFARPARPKHFTHCAAIARDLARLQQESRMPETRNQPEPREPEALEETDQQPAETPAATVEVIETHLARAVEVYRSAGREITGDLLARFRLMVSRCDPAARAAGVTGGDWLADSLTSALGVARPGNLLNYADAVLSDWIANGRSEKPAKPATKSKTPRRETPAAGREPAAHTGIREYLEKHGGLPNGDRD